MATTRATAPSARPSPRARDSNPTCRRSGVPRASSSDDDADARVTRRALSARSLAATMMMTWMTSPSRVDARSAGALSDVSELRAQYLDAVSATTSSRRVGARRRGGAAAGTTTSTTLPMSLEGGTYVAAWTIGDSALRGVVDTGSPFLTTMRACDSWGCVRAGDVSFEAFDSTFETYGLQIDGQTRWFSGRRAKVGSFEFDELVFAVSSDVRGANAAPFFGLVKYTNRERGIRPSFLEQTDIASVGLDFIDETLTLSRESVVDPREPGVLRMVDLRAVGAPVYHYAAVCDELFINGERFQTEKPIYVVFDSGTTGMLVDSDLYETSDFHLGTYQAHMKFTDANGEPKYCGSSLRTCRGDCLFVVTPIKVPWPGCGKDFHVVFAGLSVLRNQGAMTIDAERGLVRLGPGLA